jgi:amidase
MNPPSEPLHYLQITELARLIQRREVSPLEVTRAQLDRIAALDGRLKSYAVVTPEAALAAAKAAEVDLAAGLYRGPLHGVPIGVKDLFRTRDAPTAGGMVLSRDFRPVGDAAAVQRLRCAGAVILGKLQMTEGAYSDHHPSIIPPTNPWNPEYWPGISSSGPAVATAAGLCHGALGSDTGGSIRWPCGANGLTGLKPTWGRVSRYGVLELAGSLDHVGPIGRSVTDVAAMLAAIAGHDPRDPTSLRDPVPDYLAAASLGAAGLRIGVDPGWNAERVEPCVAAVLSEAAEVLRGLGARIVEVAAPDVTQAVADWAPICAVEAAVAHAENYPAQKSDYGPVLAGVLEHGRAVPATEFHAAQLRRQHLREQFAALFADIDVLLAPVQPFAPLSLERVRTLGSQPDLIADLQRYTAPFDLTGAPTLTLPGGFAANGLPIGIQLIAPDLEEPLLVRVGAAFQSVTAWHRRHPLP